MLNHVHLPKAQHHFYARLFSRITRDRWTRVSAVCLRHVRVRDFLKRSCLCPRSCPRSGNFQCPRPCPRPRCEKFSCPFPCPRFHKMPLFVFMSKLDGLKLDVLEIQRFFQKSTVLSQTGPPFEPG